LVQAPISLLIRNGLHAGTRKLVGEVLVSSLSTVLAMVILSNLTKPAPPFAPIDGPISSAVRGSAGEETSDASADFLERVALSHVASLRAASPDAATVVATSELPTDAAIPLPAPLPPRRPAASQDHARSNKERVAVSLPKGPSPAQPPFATSEAAVVSAPVTAERFNPLQYGTRLVASLGDIVSASDKRVVEGLGSVGDALTSLVKKL
jgi:hypothetical protein